MVQSWNVFLIIIIGIIGYCIFIQYKNYEISIMNTKDISMSNLLPYMPEISQRI